MATIKVINRDVLNVRQNVLEKLRQSRLAKLGIKSNWNKEWDKYGNSKRIYNTNT